MMTLQCFSNIVIVAICVSTYISKLKISSVKLKLLKIKIIIMSKIFVIHFNYVYIILEIFYCHEYYDHFL